MTYLPLNQSIAGWLLGNRCDRHTLFPIRSLALLVVVGCHTTIGLGDVIDFEDLTLAPESNWHGPDADGTVDGNATIGSFESGGASFVNRYYESEFGDYWSGFAYSNVTDNTTPGFGNQYSAFTGSGRDAGNDNYGVAFGYDALEPNGSDADPFDPASPGDLQALPSLTLPAGAAVEELFVTNTTFTALTMRDGNQFAKQFGGSTGDDPDWFKLTAYGIDALGNPLSTAVDFYLADYRFTDNSLDYIVDDWAFFDLSALAEARSLHFNLSSSDNGDFGMNTPSYFAVDGIQVSGVPEPSSLALLGGSLLAGGIWGRFRRRKRAK